MKCMYFLFSAFFIVVNFSQCENNYVHFALPNVSYNTSDFDCVSKCWNEHELGWINGVVSFLVMLASALIIFTNTTFTNTISVIILHITAFQRKNMPSDQKVLKIMKNILSDPKP